MVDFINFFIILFLMIIVVIIVIVSLVFTYLTVSSGFIHSSPSVPSCGKIKTSMLNSVAEILEKSTAPMTIIDLGSGWGTLLLPLAQKFPQHHFIGYEIGRLPHFISSLRGKSLKNIRFYRQDLMEANISSADIVFLFLLPSIMKKLAKKCCQEMKHPALIYSNRFKLPDIKGHKKISLGSDYYSYYIYKM